MIKRFLIFFFFLFFALSVPLICPSSSIRIRRTAIEINTGQRKEKIEQTNTKHMQLMNEFYSKKKKEKINEMKNNNIFFCIVNEWCI